MIVIATCFAMSLLACQDTKDDLTVPSSRDEYYKSIGQQIPFETGMRWIDVYNEKNKKTGRDNSSGYSIPASKIEEMLQSVPDLTGVAFHYGIDASGNQHILVVPVDGSLNLWSLYPGRVLLDANTGNEISLTTAQLWTLNYQLAHPLEIWYHLFGKNIFDEMVTIPYFNDLDIEPAIKDTDMSPQMLLIVWNDAFTENGRTADEPATVYDASNPCPPCGGGSNDGD